jgi:hypothetical protein
MKTVPAPPEGSNPLLTLREKIERFGEDAIPLIIPYGSKGEEVAGSPFNRYRTNFQKRTHADTLTPEYQADLYGKTRHNTGMRQGGGVTRVVGWDVDTDDPDFIAEFLEANPLCLETFTTHGSRGFTSWFIMEDEIPRPKKIILRKNLPPLKNDAIEWRSSGYSVIDGLHPDTGLPYSVIRDLPVRIVKWSDFKCPGAAYAKNWPRAFEKEEKESVQNARGDKPP